MKKLTKENLNKLNKEEENKIIISNFEKINDYLYNNISYNENNDTAFIKKNYYDICEDNDSNYFNNRDNFTCSDYSYYDQNICYYRDKCEK